MSALAGVPKVARIDRLTDEQRARMPEWRDRWIEIGLRAGAADRPKFEVAVAECYRAAKLAPPQRIVWVSSPLVLAIAAPAAALAIEWRSQIAKDPSVASALLSWLAEKGGEVGDG